MSLSLVIPESKYLTLDESLQAFYTKTPNGYVLDIEDNTITEHPKVSSIVNPLQSQVDNSIQELEQLRATNEETTSALNRAVSDTRRLEMSKIVSNLVTEIGTSAENSAVIERLLVHNIENSGDPLQEFDKNAFEKIIKQELKDIKTINTGLFEPPVKQQSFTVPTSGGTKTASVAATAGDNLAEAGESFMKQEQSEIDYESYMADYFEK